MRRVSSLTRFGAHFPHAAQFLPRHLAGVRFYSGATTAVSSTLGAVSAFSEAPLGNATTAPYTYADLRVLLERLYRGSLSPAVTDPVAVVPSWCEPFDCSGGHFLEDRIDGVVLIRQIGTILHGTVETLRNTAHTYSDTLYSASTNVPLASLIFANGKYRIVVWVRSSLSNLPNGVVGAFEQSCTVLDVDSIPRTSHGSLAVMIANAIKNAPTTLAGRLQEQINIDAGVKRNKLGLKHGDELPVPAFFKNMPAEKALRPITHYVPASFNALLKL